MLAFWCLFMLIAPSFIPSLPTYFGWLSPHVVSNRSCPGYLYLAPEPCFFQKSIGFSLDQGASGVPNACSPQTQSLPSKYRGTIIILQMMERIKGPMNTVSVYLNGCNKMPEAFCDSLAVETQSSFRSGNPIYMKEGCYPSFRFRYISKF